MVSTRCMPNGRILFFHCFLITATLTPAATPASAQDKKEGKQDEPKKGQLRMLVQPEPGKKNVNTVVLRPNTATTQSLYYTRPGEKAFPLYSLIQADGRVIAHAELADPKAKGESRLIFRPALEKDPDKTVKAPSGKAADKIFIKGPPFDLVLMAGTESFPFVVEIHEPRRFVDIVLARYELNNNKLHFKLKMKDDATGPLDCPVQLVLGPEFEVPKGVLQNLLTEPMPTDAKEGDKKEKKNPLEAELFADNVKFREGHDRGIVSLKVDGYDRAFNYLVVKGKEALTELNKNDQISAALPSRLYLVPTEKKLRLKLELNGPLYLAHPLELGLDRTGADNPEKQPFQPLKKYTGLREQILELGFTKDGNLLWTTVVKDWQDDFEVAGVVNPVWFKVAVKGNDVKLRLLDGTNLSRDENQQAVGNSLYTRIIFDDMPPQNVHFVDLPGEETVGKVLKVTATADFRPPSRQAPIDKVFFFVGKVGPDGKIVPDGPPIKGDVKFVESKPYWSADIRLPEKKDSLDISVQMITQNELSAFSEARTIRLLPPPKPPAKSYNIKGTVLHGDAPQAKLKVGLFDAKTLEMKKVVDTDNSGKYIFEKVDPGSYLVSAGTNYPKTAGQTAVIVPPVKAPPDEEPVVEVTPSLTGTRPAVVAADLDKVDVILLAK